MNQRIAQLNNTQGPGSSNLEAHMALNQFTQQQNAQKQQAAQQEAEYYARLNEKAEKMLGPDRERFNKMIADMQGSIRDKVAFYGGSMKDFLKNGGHRIMESFTGKITASPEYNSYIKNKENSVKLMDAIESGHGHLISPRDKQAMEQYELTGQGKITYSGLMTEIDMPSANNYNLGQDIPMTDILFNEGNYMKVLSNYMTNFPNDKNPTTEDLLGFMHLMGYGKKGSNREALNAARRAKEQAIKDAKAQAKEIAKQPQLYSTTLSGILSDYVKPGESINNFYDTDANTFKPKNRLKNLIQNGDTYLANNVDGEFKLSSYAVNENESGWDADTDNFINTMFQKNFGNRYAPTEAYEVASQHKQTIAELYLAKEANEQGNFFMDPSNVSDMFSTKGVELTGSNNLEAGEYEGEYENVGIITGLVGKTAEGNNQMLMNIVDSDGEIDTDKQRDFINGMDNGEVKMSYFIALKNKDNERLYYKRINLDDTNKLSSLNAKIGSADDMKKQNQAANRLSAEKKQAAADVAAAQNMYDQQLLSIDARVEQSPNFQQEAMMYAKSGNEAENRSSIMKSFYSVTGLDVNSQAFHEYMQLAPEAAKLMRIYGTDITEEQLIDNFIDEVNRSSTPEEISSNEELRSEWKNAYKRYMEINKE